MVSIGASRKAELELGVPVINGSRASGIFLIRHRIRIGKSRSKDMR